MTYRLLCCIGSLDGGGSERQLLQFAQRVDGSQFAPSIYLLHRRGPLLGQVPANIPVHAFGDDEHKTRTLMPGRIHARQVEDLGNVIRRESIDVVYDRTFHMTLVTAAACDATHTPRLSVIVSPPSQDFHLSRERFHRIKRSRLARAYQTGTTIAVSEAVADDAAEYYRLNRERIVVLPNPVDIESVTRAAEQSVAPQKPKDGELHIATIGRLSSEKGHATAIGALAEARELRPDLDLHLDILGDGPLRKELVNLVRSLSVEDKVHFHGYVDNPYPLIARSHLVCIPSVYEGLPNVALESLALAKPLIATHCSQSVVDLVGGDKQRGVVVPINDSHTMARQFVDRFEDPQAWHERGERGADWVRHHHSLPQWLERIQSCLTEAVRTHALRDPQGRNL